LEKRLFARTRRINFDWIEPGRKIRIRIDQDQARLLGLSSESIAAVMNKVMTGAAVTQVRDGIYLDQRFRGLNHIRRPRRVCRTKCG
jgi:multidrug efflux pump subunit AcrB